MLAVEGHVSVGRKESGPKESIRLVCRFLPENRHQRLKTNLFALFSYSGMIQVALETAGERSRGVSDVDAENTSVLKDSVAFRPYTIQKLMAEFECLGLVGERPVR